MVDQLYLIRHGRTAYNAERRFQGQVDTALDEVGAAQAQAIARHLGGVGITKLASSDLLRTRQTVAALEATTGLTATFDAGLREINVGDWEGLTHLEIAARWPAEHAHWAAGEDMRPPGGERRSESNRRVAAAVERIVDDCAPEDVLAIVAHGSVIRGAASILLGLDDSSPGRLGILDNCEYVHFLWRQDRWVLRRWAGRAQA